MWSNPRIPYQMASDRPPLTPPGGKSLMVNVVINIEYWPFDRPMPRGVLPAPHGKTPEPPDVPNFAWVEYGMRCGMPRLMEMSGGPRDIKASAFLQRAGRRHLSVAGRGGCEGGMGTRWSRLVPAVLEAGGG